MFTQPSVTQNYQMVQDDEEEEHEIFIPFDRESEDDLSDGLVAEGCEFIIEHLPGLEILAHAIKILDVLGQAHDIDQRPIYQHEFVQALARFKLNPYYIPGNRQGVWVRFKMKPALRQVMRVGVVNGASGPARVFQTTNAQVPVVGKAVTRSPWTITPPSLHPSWMRGRRK